MELPTRYDKLLSHEKRIVREEYRRLQEDVCPFCKAKLTEEPPDHIRNKPIDVRRFPEGFFKSPIHLHHSHITDMTLGAVHSKCNAVLWQYYGE